MKQCDQDLRDKVCTLEGELQELQKRVNSSQWEVVPSGKRLSDRLVAIEKLTSALANLKAHVRYANRDLTAAQQLLNSQCLLGI